MQVRDEFHTQLRGRISESLIDERELIGQMYVNAELPYYKQYTPDMSYDELAGDARVYLHINLNGPYHDKESFAKDIQNILSKLDPLGLDIRNLTFRYDGEEVDFGLDLYDRYQLDMKLDELVRRVDADWYHEDEESSARDGFSDESALPPLEPLENDGFSNEWPDRIVYSADGMTAHSYYFDLPVPTPRRCRSTSRPKAVRWTCGSPGRTARSILRATTSPRRAGARPSRFPYPAPTRSG